MDLKASDPDPARRPGAPAGEVEARVVARLEDARRLHSYIESGCTLLTCDYDLTVTGAEANARTEARLLGLLLAENAALRLAGATAQQQIAQVTAQRDARRTHQGKIAVAALKLYERFGQEDADVMEVWSWAIVDPEPPTEAEIARGQELAKRFGWETRSPDGDGQGDRMAIPPLNAENDAQGLTPPQADVHARQVPAHSVTPSAVSARTAAGSEPAESHQDWKARAEQAEREFRLEKAAHQFTIDMERRCGQLLVRLNHIVGVPDDSSLVREIQKLKDAEADRDRLIARVQQLKQTWTHDASCWPPFGSGACAIKAIQKCLADLEAALKAT